MNELKKLFSIADSDNSGAISITEFKKISDNSIANELFRRWIKKLRQSKYKNMQLEFFLPFNLNRLLDHLSTMTKRDYLMDRIDKHKYDIGETQNIIKTFIKLFILDESAMESCIKEEQAKIIESSLQAVNEKERIANRLMSKRRGINRLDSVFLDQLTIDLLNKNFLKRSSLGTDVENNLAKKLEEIREDYAPSDSDSDSDSSQSELEATDSEEE